MSYVFTSVPFQSTHPLRGGTLDDAKQEVKALFQSTHPLRGGTGTLFRLPGQHLHFNPPPLAGWNRRTARPSDAASTFQSTHPLRGGTFGVDSKGQSDNGFQSTHPLRGGTFYPSATVNFYYYFKSTHPLRVGPRITPAMGRCKSYFNPPTPCGVGPEKEVIDPLEQDFNPPTPWRGGTAPSNYYILFIYISIHPPPCGVGRPREDVSPTCDKHFNPPTPCGVGLINPQQIIRRDAKFQSTHPLRGGTQDRRGSPN